MIMDDNGIVNLHKDFIEKPGRIEGQHIVEKVIWIDLWKVQITPFVFDSLVKILTLNFIHCLSKRQDCFSLSGARYRSKTLRTKGPGEKSMFQL